MDNETKEMFSILIDKINDLDQKVNDLNQKFDGLNQEFDGLSSEVRALRGVLENEINKNIKIIAEGYVTQTEKYNNYIKILENVRARQELTEIRLNTLESDIRILKGNV